MNKLNKLKNNIIEECNNANIATYGEDNQNTMYLGTNYINVYGGQIVDHLSIQNSLNNTHEIQITVNGKLYTASLGLDGIECTRERLFLNGMYNTISTLGNPKGIKFETFKKAFKRFVKRNVR